MYLIFLKESAFKIKPSGKEKGPIILLKPFSVKKSNLKLPNLKADILLLDQGEKRLVPKTFQGFVIDTPGEYEIQDVFIYGLGEETLIYHLEYNQVKIGYLGEVSKPPKDKQIEQLDKVEVLILPISGKKVLNLNQAREIIHQIKPKIIIPCSFSLKDKTLERFLKEFGQKKEWQNKLKITKKDLSKEEMKIIVLKPLLE